MPNEIREFDSLIDLLEDLDREGITGERKNAAVQYFLSNLARVKGRPLVASFELTPLCNFNCPMCYVHLSKSQLGGNALLSVEQWKYIIDMSVSAGIMYADITGGECLTYPGFKEIYLHLWKKGIQPSVLTNGSLLTDDIVSFFQEYPPHLIQITLYGSNPGAYIRVTDCDAFDSVMSGIKKLREAGIRFKLTITPNRYMQDDVNSLLQLVREMNVDYGIGGVTLASRPETGRIVDDFRLDEKLFVSIHKDESQYRKTLNNLKKGDESWLYKFRVKGRNEWLGIPCSSGRGTFHVNWKGEMTPCISFYSVTSSILENGVEKSWNIIHRAMSTYRDPDECKTCDIKKWCTSCPAEKRYGKLDGELNKSVCERLRLYIATGLVEDEFVYEGVRKDGKCETDIF